MKIELVESFHGFYAYQGERCICLGDGVDVEMIGSDGETLRVGEPGFREAWEASLNEDHEFLSVVGGDDD